MSNSQYFVVRVVLDLFVLCSFPISVCFAQGMISQEFDLGIIEESANVVFEHEFELINNSNNRISFDRAIPSCKCIQVVEGTSLSLEPNSSRKIKISLDTSGQHGKIEHSVVLKSNEAVYRLRMSAIKKGVWASPNLVEIGFISGDKEHLATIPIFESGFSNGKIESVTCDNDFFSVAHGKAVLKQNSPRVGRPVGAIQISLNRAKLEAPDVLGTQSGDILVQIDCGEGSCRSVSIKVNSTVVSRHCVIPRAIFFGSVVPGNQYVRNLSFEPSDETGEFVVDKLSVTSDAEYVTASVVSNPKSTRKFDISLRLELTRSIKPCTKLLEGEVRITMDKTEIVSIPYLAVVRFDQSPVKSDIVNERKGVGVIEDLDWFDALKIPESAPKWTVAHYILAASKQNMQRQELISKILRVDTNNPGFVRSNKRVFGSNNGPFFEIQHHPDQFLAYLGLGGVPLNDRRLSKAKEFSIADIINDSKWSTSLRGEEVSWKVIAYCVYGVNDDWTNKFSETINLESVVCKLMAQEEPACFGTHKSMAMTLFNNFQNSANFKGSEELKSQIGKVLEKQIQGLKNSQRPNGSFELPINPKGPDKRYLLDAGNDILFTGHTLEHLMASDTSNPNDPWVLKAVEFLNNAVAVRKKRYESLDFENEQFCREFGQLCHAIAGLKRWHDRIIELKGQER